ncbi:Hypothetical_protein [Hexamita inflata]|uniref:Hypothetical_protein n=1 Tax=Hexamita inflata TaxID=28002 RepID=A0AA86QBL7_9EUKA|nr:Hypothetical protein HINF_LOCUS36775 [Hexamita inflata]
MECYISFNAYTKCNMNCDHECTYYESDDSYCCFEIENVVWWVWFILACVILSIFACIGCCICCCCGCCQRNKYQKLGVQVVQVKNQPMQHVSYQAPPVPVYNALAPEMGNPAPQLF